MKVLFDNAEISVLIGLEHEDEQLYRPKKSTTIEEFLTDIGLNLKEKISVEMTRGEWLTHNTVNMQYGIKRA